MGMSVAGLSGPPQACVLESYCKRAATWMFDDATDERLFADSVEKLAERRY
jgi:hypothetical protein